MWKPIKEIAFENSIPENELLEFASYKDKETYLICDNEVAPHTVQYFLKDFYAWKQIGVQQIAELILKEARKRIAINKSLNLREHLELIYEQLKNEVRNSL